MKKGSKMSAESRLKMSISASKKRLSEEHKRKIGIASKRPNLGQFKKGRQSQNKGKNLSEETKNKIRLARLGKKLSAEHKEKIGASIRRKNLVGENHWNWQGGKSDNRHKVRTVKYKQWVSDIFSRDNWTCQTCGVRGTYLQAHHIKSWAHYPALRYDVNNGVTLCLSCHKLTDNYGGKGKKL